jgi:superfamily II DNA or RNA helicase
MALFQCVVVDEAHGIKGEVLQKLLNEYGGHIAYRYGVTGTLPKAEVDQMAIRVTIGDTLYSIRSDFLIEQEFLSKLDIEPYQTQESADLPDWSAEKAYLEKHDERTEYIANLIIEKCNEYGNTLILVNNIKTGRKLVKLIPNAVYLDGAASKEDRWAQYDRYETENNIITIATVGIAAVGISIDRIFCLITVDMGKSFIRSIQAIGRGLRRSKDKDYVRVVDISSSLKFAKRHLNERLKYFKEAGYPTHKTQKINLINLF